MVQFLVPIQLNRCTKSKDFWDADVFCLRLFTLSASNPMNLLSACPSWAEYYNPPCQSAGALGAILLFTLAVAFFGFSIRIVPADAGYFTMPILIHSYRSGCSVPD